MMKMHYILILGLAGSAACGEKRSSVDFGKTSASDLLSEKGTPISKQKIPVQDGVILEFSNNQKYQIENDVVTYGLKDPVKEEKSLLYWKHKWKNCETQVIKLKSKDPHTIPEMELACPSAGISVIYSEGADLVLRVIEYAKK